MSSLWDDRLAEVWAPPGRAGSGVVVGAFGVLTARHVVAEVADGSAAGTALARVIRRGAPPAWVPMRVAADAAEWDLAMLEVDRDRPEAAAWVPPASPSPVMVAVDAGSVEGCETVGFPSEEVQQRDGAGPAEVVRQSEQLRGTLLPKGQAKPPTAPRPGLPREWMPLDASTAAPGEQAGWRGMSGAGVLLPDGRLTAVVVAAESAHQQRRLYVVPLAPALTTAPDLTAALATVTGAAVVVEAQPAPAYRRVLYSESLRADGTPLQLGEVTDLGVFGVKPADLAGEPTYLNYVPRDDDGRLREALREATAARQALLLVGDSGSGKTRSAAQAARGTYGTHRLLRPAEHQLAQLPDIPLAGLGSALVWLDDVEKYAHPALREILQRMLDAGMVVIGTIRREELQALAVTGEIRNPSGEALTDERLVQRLDWKREWSQPERDRTAEYINSPLAWQAVDAGLPLGVWAVAGPRLLQELRDARNDEDYPCRFKLVRAVLDWYRTGLTDPLPWPVAVDLINRAYLDQPASDKELVDARDWCIHPIPIGGRRGRYSLLALHDDGLAINDYVQDHDRRHEPPPVPDPTWAAALASASGTESLWNVGLAAYTADQMVISEAAMRTLVDAGDTNAMTNLGVLLEDRDPPAARRWAEQAAAAGDPVAMFNLGVLLNDRDPRAARRWYEQAAEHGHTKAKYALGVLLKDRNPDAARRWYEQAAAAGDTAAMTNLGVQLEARDPDAARRWYEQAAAAGDPAAMFNLGVLLEARDPDAARRWWEQAAAAGDTVAMFNLGVQLNDRDPDAARRWWEQAAAAGHAAAMTNLGVQLNDRDPDAARRWWEQAAAAGDTVAMTNLGVLLEARDPDAARRWYEQAAAAGDTAAMTNLGVIE